MSKKKNIYILLSILVVVGIATVIASNISLKKEKIKTSGEVVLEINPSDVTNLSWTIDDNTLSFSKDESFIYDDDTSFPLDNTKIVDLLGIFKSFSSSFVIEEVTDYSQYGLDKPLCTINIETTNKTYTIKLGNMSKMDEQRYVDIGDGNVYLAVSDPYDSYNVELSSLILNDEIPSMKEVTSITFKGNENYTITKQDGISLCEDDMYFTNGEALDNDLLDSYISIIKNLSLYDCVTYNVSEEELIEYGLDNPELEISLNYTSREGEENQSISLYVSSNKEQLETYNNTLDEDKNINSVTRYIRVNNSKIIYTITSSTYDTLTSNAYNDLRHQEIFMGDFDSISSIDVTLENNNYRFIKNDDTYMYDDEKIEITTLQNAITSLNADSFTNDVSTGQKEVSITLNLDNENYPTYKMDFYRYDGNKCLVYINDKPYAYVKRSAVVDIIEAINQIVLK